MLGHVRIDTWTNIEVEPVIRWIINLPHNWINFSIEIYRNKGIFFFWGLNSHEGSYGYQ